LTNSNFANANSVNSNLGDSANPNSNFGSLASRDGINFKAVLSGETSTETDTATGSQSTQTAQTAQFATQTSQNTEVVTAATSTQTAQFATQNTQAVVTTINQPSTQNANQPSDEIIKNTLEYYQQDNSQNAQFIPLVIGLLALGTVSYLNAPGINDKPKSGMTPVAEAFWSVYGGIGKKGIEAGVENAAKTATKEATEALGEKLAKESAKDGAKFVSETATKTAAKESTEALGEKLAKESAKDGAKFVSETATKTTAKETTEALGEKVAKDVAKDGTEVVSQNLVKTAEKKAVEDSTKTVTANAGSAKNVLNGNKLNEYYRQLEKYGKGGVKELDNGKIRFYDKLDPASTQGEMIGRRSVREWDPTTGATRTWQETIDVSGNIRQVRPDTSITNGEKIHYRFDANGNYIGTKEGITRGKK